MKQFQIRSLQLMWTVLIVGVTLFGLIPNLAFAEEGTFDLKGRSIYIVPVEQTIESGLESFLQRAFQEAAEMQAGQIILTIDTLGGRVDSAGNIGTLIRESPVPVTAYIHGKAASAGSYIALNADRIAMAPGSAIGAAALVDAFGARVTDSKLVGLWVSQMVSAAELNGRNPDIAAGMVDDSLVVPMPEISKTSGAGEIISLSANEAFKVGYSDFTANSLDDVLAWIGADSNKTITIQPSFAEKLAGWVTMPLVRTLLLLIGLAGVAIELFVPGFGVPGIVGVVAFGFYFFGHYVAGFAGVEEVALFLLGIILLIIEIFMPSFGVLGIIGIISLICGIVLAAYDTASAAVSLGIAFAAAAVVVFIVAKIFKRRGVWNRFILSDEQKNEEGYVSASVKEDLLHQEGTSLTPLRPAGTASIGEERVDVVTSGEFIAAGQPIVVVKVEGTRVIVKEVKRS